MVMAVMVGGIFRYSMQLLDEIPMVWSSCAFIYCQHMVTSRSEPSLPVQCGLHVGLVKRGWAWQLSLPPTELCSPFSTLPGHIQYYTRCTITFCLNSSPYSSAGDVWGAGVLHDLPSCDDTQRRIQQSQHEVSRTRQFCSRLITT